MIAPRRVGIASARVQSAVVVYVFALSLALGLPALSAAQTSAASEAAATGVAAVHDAETVVDGESAIPADSVPGSEERPRSGPIVLVLPLASERFRRVAEAVQAGFLAAAEAARVKPLVIAHGDADVMEAFAKAKAADARVIVGPLVRDDMKALASAGSDLPPTIALNQLDEGAPLPRNVYILTLTIDGEARQLARLAKDAGAVNVAVIASDTPRQQRFASAFNAEWILAGGGAPVMFRFDPTPDVLRLLKRELGRTAFDVALLAVDAADAALAKPYVGSIPSYTSSEVNERQSPDVLRELDNVRFVEIPWLVDAGSAAFPDLKRPDYPNPALERLYALGVDAFRVARAFANGRPSKLEFDGATGHVSLDSMRQFIREGRLMQFRGGRVVPAGAR